MSLWNWARAFFEDPKYHSGYDSIATRLTEHIEYSLFALAIAALIGLPLAMLSGHTGRGDLPISAVAVIGRAMPSLGLLILLTVAYGFGFMISMIPLILLGIPPILLYTHAGIRGVDRAAVDAARGLGMTHWQTLWQVEIPAALPLILSGLRVAMVTIVATATIAAYVSLGGLGQYIVDGLAQYDYAQVVGGSVLVAGLTVATLLVFWLLDRILVSPGLRSRRAASR